MATLYASKELPDTFDQQVAQIEESLRPDVVRIRYSTDYDWSGDPALYFRIVLSDDAASEQKLSKVTNRVRDVLYKELEFADSKYIPYFNFRSKTGSDRLRDPAWE